MDEVLLLLDAVLVHLSEKLLTLLDISDEAVASTVREILANDYAEHLEVLGVGRHGIRGDNPAANAQLVSEGELVIVAVFLGRETEGY